MPRRVWFRGLILLLVLTLLAPSAIAAGNGKPAGLSVRGFVSALWQALVKLIPMAGESSGTMDPDGRPNRLVPSGFDAPADEPTTDLGPGLDPAGTPNG